jgi:hypothetical protein
MRVMTWQNDADLSGGTSDVIAMTVAEKVLIVGGVLNLA